MKKKKEGSIVEFYTENKLVDVVFAKTPSQLKVFLSTILEVCYSVGDSVDEDNNEPFKCSLCKSVIRPKHRKVVYGKVTYIYNAEYLAHLMFYHNLLPPWKLIQAILHSYFSTIQIKKAITDMSREELIEMLEDNNSYIKNMEVRLQALEEERVAVPAVNVSATIASLITEEAEEEEEEAEEEEAEAEE